MQELFIGVDIGGTRTKSGLVNIDTGEVLHSIVQPTEKKMVDVFIEGVGDTISACKGIAAEKGKTIAGIGFGIPGFMTAEGKVLTTYGFLDFMEEYPLKSIVENRFSLPCLLDNDARIVALGGSLVRQRQRA